MNYIDNRKVSLVFNGGIDIGDGMLWNSTFMNHLLLVDWQNSIVLTLNTSVIDAHMVHYNLYP